MTTFLWGGFPYIAFTLLIVGLVWRYKTDQYGWTTRSSQIYEGKFLRISSPLFHFGVLFVAAGHLMGLVIPQSFTDALGVSEHAYHLVATIGGGIAAIMTVAGLVGLLWRRFVVRSVRLATSTNDKIMYAFLTVAIALGTAATTMNQVLSTTGGYNYRETIAVWFRSIFYFDPHIELMADVPLSFKLHIVSGLLLFCVWPFTRLVHVMSVPVAYTTRPMIIYRTREAATRTTPYDPGWKPVHVADDEHRRAVRQEQHVHGTRKTREHVAPLEGA